MNPSTILSTTTVGVEQTGRTSLSTSGRLGAASCGSPDPKVVLRAKKNVRLAAGCPPPRPRNRHHQRFVSFEDHRAWRMKGKGDWAEGHTINGRRTKTHLCDRRGSRAVARTRFRRFTATKYYYSVRHHPPPKPGNTGCTRSPGTRVNNVILARVEPTPPHSSPGIRMIFLMRAWACSVNYIL